MTSNDKLREKLICDRVNGVFHDTKYVKSGQNGFSKLDVLLEWNSRIVATADRVGGSHNCAACLQRRDDSCFGDGNRLLFHRLVDRRPVRVVHFIELINKAVALVRKDQCTTFKRPLPSYRVFANTGGKTDSGGALACCENGTMRGLLYVLQELRFRGTGVSEKEDVDVSTNSVLPVDVLRYTAKQREGDSSLDVLVPIDRRGDGLDDSLPNPIVPGEGTNFLLVLFGESEGSELVLFLVDVVGLDDSREDREAVLGVE